MDYLKLATELLNTMQTLQKKQSQKIFTEAIHGEAFVLNYIANQKGDVLPGEISQKMDVSSARIAAALNSLGKKELITRRIDINDRRKILINITAKGKDLALQHRQSILLIASKNLELLGEHDANEYIRILKKLAEIIPENNEQHIVL